MTSEWDSYFLAFTCLAHAVPSIICSELQYKGDKSIHLQCEKQQHRSYEPEASSGSCLSGTDHDLRLNPGMNHTLAALRARMGFAAAKNRLTGSHHQEFTPTGTSCWPEQLPQLSAANGKVWVQSHSLLHFPAVNWFHRPQQRIPAQGSSSANYPDTFNLFFLSLFLNSCKFSLWAPS